MENLLQGIRDRTMQATPEIVDVLFSCFDVISMVIDTVAEGKKPDADLSEIINRIQKITDAEAPKRVPGTAEAAEAETEIPRIKLEAGQVKTIRDGMQIGKSCCEITVFIEPAAQMKWIKAQLVMQNLSRIGNVVASQPPSNEITDATLKDVFSVILLTESSLEDIRGACDVDQVLRIDMRKISLSKKDDKTVLTFHEKETLLEDAREEELPMALMEPVIEDTVVEKDHDDEEEEEQYKVETLRRKDDKKVPSLKIVKVSVDKLDLLLNNVGELVIANSGFFKLYEELRKSGRDKTITNEFKNRMDQMSRIAKDLQNGIMKTRMVPIGQVFSRFNRLVRDLAKEFGKKVVLVTKGEDTELDKKVIDAIGEPLMHLIRNGIDHGIETSEERRRLKKQETATITLSAYQSGNQIFVVVSDDGRGLDARKIRKKVVEKGLATAEMVANMEDDDIFNYIYAPGFSTTEVVTDISGRGVGMNVVKEIVSELNGSVNIETELGMGTRFVLTFPLTLAIIPAIMVKVSGELYAIPLSDVIETIKISLNDITTIEGHEVINLRGEILSLLRLSDFVGIESVLEEDRKTPVVVVGYGNRKIGLIVDQLEGKQEIVIKPLEQNYSTVEGLAGASILGDGSISLILDVASMINKVIADQEKMSRIQRKRASQARQAEVEHVDVPAVQKGMEETEKPPLKKEEPETGPAPTVVAEVKEDIVFSRDEKTEPEKPVSAPSVPDEPVSMETIPPADGIAGGDGEDMDVDQKVRDALKSFKDELKENIKSTMGTGASDEHVKKSLQITEDDVHKIQVIANTGIANAAESLSKILNKRIDLSIPSVSMMPVEKIPESVGELDSVYIGVYMPLVGDIKGTILFALKEDSGFDLIDMLYGIESGKTRELNEDGESALKEVTNIIGASVINVIAEQTSMAIKPDVPMIVHDYM
ncbi:MAG TPA: hypothetical protein ENN21_03715, partial [Spirochaetes bacterium]|nr:hypothetical protein [Spirochaetota bacterium]